MTLPQPRWTPAFLGAVLCALGGLALGREFAAAEVSARPAKLSVGLSLEPASTAGRLRAHDDTLAQILGNRGYSVSLSHGSDTGCRSAPGLADYEGELALFVAQTPWGWLIDVPHEGLRIIDFSTGLRLTGPEACTPVDRQ